MTETVDNSAVAVDTAVADAEVKGPNQAVAESEDPRFIMVKDMKDLEKKAPKVYKAMLEGIMIGVMAKCRHHDEEMKKLRRENESKS